MNWVRSASPVRRLTHVQLRRADLAQRRGDAPGAQRELETARRLYAEMGVTAQVGRWFEKH